MPRGACWIRRTLGEQARRGRELKKGDSAGDDLFGSAILFAFITWPVGALRVRLFRLIPRKVVPGRREVIR